uniref:Uncharacterized protein n=1 Tax=Brassica campestris TaxID=3711 RepID=A0A3P6CKB1_BRACM|nr:unnamed protein product [Brassica rapa]
MHSNSQTPVTGDVPATKPNGKDVASSAEPIKQVDQTESLSIQLPARDSGIRSEAAKPLSPPPKPIKRVDQTGDSFLQLSPRFKPKKSNGKAVVYSAGPVKRVRQHGVPLANALGPQEGAS